MNNWYVTHRRDIIARDKPTIGYPLTTVNALGGAIRGAHMGEPYEVKWYLKISRDSTVQTLRKTSRDMVSVYYTCQLFGAFSVVSAGGAPLFNFRENCLAVKMGNNSNANSNSNS